MQGSCPRPTEALEQAIFLVEGAAAIGCAAKRANEASTQPADGVAQFANPTSPAGQLVVSTVSAEAIAAASQEHAAGQETKTADNHVAEELPAGNSLTAPEGVVQGTTADGANGANADGSGAGASKQSEQQNPQTLGSGETIEDGAQKQKDQETASTARTQPDGDDTEEKEKGEKAAAAADVARQKDDARKKQDEEAEKAKNEQEVADKANKLEVARTKTGDRRRSQAAAPISGCCCPPRLRGS